MLSHRGAIQDFGLPVPLVIRATAAQEVLDGYQRLELQVMGIVDTGASRSAVSKRAADELGLGRDRRITMLTAAGPYSSPEFEIDIFVILNHRTGRVPIAELAGRELLVR